MWCARARSVYLRVKDLSRTVRSEIFAMALLAIGASCWCAHARAENEPQSGRLEGASVWLRDEVILDGTPLAEAVARMSRYDRRRRMIVDPAIAAVRISGVYHTGNLELFAAMVARLYGFRVTHQDGRIHLLAPTPTLTAEK
jgi:ferric-dicitrate binding protein FerR (iron transport regulator)